MKKFTFLSIILSLSFLFSSAQRTIIHCGKLIDVKGKKVLTNYSVIVNGNKIEDLKEGFVQASSTDKIIDLKAMTVMPGLMDMHVHMESETKKGGAVETFNKNPADYAYESVGYANKTLMAGFTTVRDLGGSGVNVSLRNELAVYEKAPDEVTVTLDHFVESGFGPDAVWEAFVAASPDPSNGGEIIHGFALYYIRYSTWKGQRMYLEDLLVTEEMRCKGIGKLLFDRLIEEAKENGFNGIVWQVLEWNEPAINFYKKYNASFDGEWVNCSISV